MEERIIKDINNLLAQLFQKMKESGYEWDAEKKELKKIEQNMELTDFESALFTAFSDAWQSCLLGEEVNVEQWAKEHSKELLEAAKEELKEQKPAWSEEDEENLNWFEKFFRAESVVAEGKDIPQDRYLWFKNLKYRVQPKQEWSEEDERNLNDAILFIETGTYSLDKDNLINWLKSLRPQNRWKPSDEQIKALSNALSLAKNCGEESAFDLRTLYEQLKKLREE